MSSTSNEEHRPVMTLESLLQIFEEEQRNHRQTKEDLEILRHDFEQMKKDNETRDLEMHKLWNEVKRLSSK